MTRRRRTFPMPGSLAAYARDDEDPESIGCNGCTACCHDNLIALFPEDGDDVEKYGDAVETHGNPINGEMAHFIKHRDDGACWFLGETGCEIYDDRPAVCRVFDCRPVYRAYKAECSPVQIKQALRRGILGRGVFKAGKDRQPK